MSLQSVPTVAIDYIMLSLPIQSSIKDYSMLCKPYKFSPSRRPGTPHVSLNAMPFAGTKIDFRDTGLSLD